MLVCDICGAGNGEGEDSKIERIQISVRDSKARAKEAYHHEMMDLCRVCAEDMGAAVRSVVGELYKRFESHRLQQGRHPRLRK